MTFKNYNEAFDKPYEWKGSNGQYQFELENGYIGWFEVEHTYDEDIGTCFNDIGFIINGQISVTNKGDAFRIFATIFDIIKKNKDELTFDNQTLYTQFTAKLSDKSRVKLYNRFAKMLKKEMKYQYMESFVYAGDRVYVFFDDQELLREF